jgi:DNA-binding XRE family transcriptional regulator
MNESDAASKRTGELESKSVDVGNFSRPGMDPNYGSREGSFPRSPTATRREEPGPVKQTGDFAWIQAWHDEQAAKLKAELRFQLQVMPSGQRIRNLRSLLGWTQRRVAMELGISMRTVIRHERGQRRTPWLRLSLLLRLRELESDHEGKLIAFFTHTGREHT